MKRALKITGIILASLVGIVLLVAIIAVSTITSSGRLTKIVKKYAPQFVHCEMQLGKADLTLVKTFPNVGLAIENVALINPMPGSPSDTLANINNLIVVLDAKKLTRNKEIVVRKCILEDAFINIYTDSLGANNFSVFNTQENADTTQTTVSYSFDIENVKLKNNTLLYTDDRNGLTTQAQSLNLDLNGKMNGQTINADIGIDVDGLGLKMKAADLLIHNLNLNFKGDVNNMDKIDGTLKLSTPDVFLSLSDFYLKHDTLRLDLPFQLSLNDKKGHLNKAQIGINQYLITFDGDAGMADNGEINLDLSLNTNTLLIEDVLTYLPDKLQKQLSGIEYAGKLTISDAHVKGTFNDSLMPLVSAKIVTDNASAFISQLPYPFKNIDADAALNLNLNNNTGSLTLNSMSAKFNRSELNIKGLVDDLLGAIGLNLDIKGEVPMTDLKGFLPKDIKLQGNTLLDLNTNFTVNQLMASIKDYNLNRIKAKGSMRIKGFSLDQDTLHVASPLVNIGISLPASAVEKGQKGTYITIRSQQLEAQMGKSLRADLKHPNIKFSADNFTGNLEQMLVDAALSFSYLDVVYDSIKTTMEAPAFTVLTMPEKDSKGLKARVTLDSKNVDTDMGKAYTLNTNSLKINASVNQNKAKTDFLNQWNPSADFMLGNAVLKVGGLSEDIRINNIDFLFNSHELNFKKSTFRIGQSDMSMEGNVIGIKEWIEDHKNLMIGELQLTSDLLEINEILNLTSGLGVSKEPETDTANNAAKTKGDNPFIVPEGIDFNFGIKTKKSLYDNFDLNNLSGTLTIKDGTLILQEIGFTNKAAEMQLTAMYQSPRKNNLFLAMDFHLLNVQINDLLHMVPYIDTLVPMLKTFDGQAEFHIGAETYLKSNYQPKISTLRAAADIEGKNLYVNDKFTFTRITDMLDVSNNGEYRVDSLDVQLTAFKDEIDLWPSQIAIGKYKVTVDGRMTLDKNGEYHLSVTESPLPLRLGLKISGPFNKLEYKLEECKYPNLYKPNKRNDTEQMYFELKKRIANRLKENVR